MKLLRTNSDNPEFQKLVIDLESYLTLTDEEAHKVCKPYNQLETIKHVIIINVDDEIAGCGAIRAYDSKTIEIKRMFVAEKFRNQGIATKILKELENWAKELGFDKSILETGSMMPAAIAFYKRNDYLQIPNYGQYSANSKSICFGKNL